MFVLIFICNRLAFSQSIWYNCIIFSKSLVTCFLIIYILLELVNDIYLYIYIHTYTISTHAQFRVFFFFFFIIPFYFYNILSLFHLYHILSHICDEFNFYISCILIMSEFCQYWFKTKKGTITIIYRWHIVSIVILFWIVTITKHTAFCTFN